MQHDSEATYALGLVYANGWGVKQCDKKAIDYFLEAAKSGYAPAQYSIAVMYDNGRGVEEDEDKAFFWYKAAASQQHPKAQYNLGIIYQEGYGQLQSYAKAFDYFLPSATQGFVEAQFYIGEFYENGYGVVDVDGEAAIEWYTKASQQGHQEAKFNIGIIYGNGTLVPVDYVKAAKWFLEAATLENEEPHMQAAFNLATMYKKGQGVEKDLDLARKWFQIAKEQDHPQADFELLGLPQPTSTLPVKQLSFDDSDAKESTTNTNSTENTESSTKEVSSASEKKAKRNSKIKRRRSAVKPVFSKEGNFDQKQPAISINNNISLSPARFETNNSGNSSFARSPSISRRAKLNDRKQAGPNIKLSLSSSKEAIINSVSSAPLVSEVVSFLTCQIEDLKQENKALKLEIEQLKAKGN